MKKSLNQKLISILILLSIAATSLAAPARAQEAELIPPARGDYEVEASPYQGQDYQVRTANPDPITDWIIRKTLGALANEVMGQVGENVMKWMGDLMHWGIFNSYLLLAGEEGVRGSGYCTSDKGTVIENQCSDNYVPALSGDGNVCQCVLEISALQQNPSDRGAMGVLAGMTGGLLKQSPPNLQTAQYFKHELADNILTGHAYAKTGIEIFDPIISIAALMRNLAYIFMFIILIGMGLMVMTRRQVSPRAVMTISAGLPRVVMSLILIAFSYPLAGFLVDIGRVIKALIDTTFGALMPLIPVEPFQLIAVLFGNFASMVVLGPITWGGWGNINLGGTGTFSFLISLGIMIVAVVITFMLFFTLVFRFASLFVQVIFAPLAFAWGSLPGQEDTISRWFKGFIVNVLTFPVIYFIVNLANYISFITLVPGINLSLPADLGWGTLGGPWPTDVGGLVAFGLLMAATKVPAMLEEALEVTAPAAVSRAGVEPGKVLQKVPVVGGMFK